MDRGFRRKEVLDLDTQNALLSSYKLVRDKIDSLKKQLANSIIAKKTIKQAQVLICDFCELDHSNGQYIP